MSRAICMSWRMVENDKIEISLADARRRNPDAQIGDIIAETLPPVDFNAHQRRRTPSR